MGDRFNQGPTRRTLIGGLLCFAGYLTTPARAAVSGDPITLQTLLHTPLLARFYAAPPQGHATPEGAAGLNLQSFRLVEDQRLGTEWVTHGICAGRPDWTAYGWKILDYGLARQMPDGGFGNVGYFHSNSLFLEGLARALLIDPGHMTGDYVSRLAAGCAWLMQPGNEELGLRQNAPYTHRCYILAACLGQTGTITGNGAFSARAARYAENGIARQRSTGVNPELGGFDVSYQMAGLLSAIRYFPHAGADMHPQLTKMIRRACNWELPYVRPDGSLNASTSTRAEHEIASGILKHPNLPEIFQTFAYADMIESNVEWRRAAYVVGKRDKLPLPDNAAQLVAG